MRSGAIARFGGFTAYGDKFHGTGWHLVDVEGWTDPPSVDMERVRRPAAHGTYRLPAYFDERVVRLSGFFVGTSHLDVEQSSEQFRSLAGDTLKLLIEDALGPRWALGTVTDVRFANHGFAPEGAWSIEITCQDSVKYGKTRTFGAGVAAVNQGNASASPVFTIVGPQPAYTITAGSRQFAVDVALPSGSTDVIDMATGWVRRNGPVLVDAVSRAQTWKIPGGLPGVTHAFSGTASRFSIAVTDTYV